MPIRGESSGFQQKRECVCISVNRLFDYCEWASVISKLCDEVNKSGMRDWGTPALDCECQFVHGCVSVCSCLRVFVCVYVRVWHVNACVYLSVCVYARVFVRTCACASRCVCACV